MKRLIKSRKNAGTNASQVWGWACVLVGLLVGPASGLPYPTAATVSQLVADINFADTTGGAFTINLQPSTTFALTTGVLPVVGGAKAVDLTILGNGDTIDGSGSFS